MATIVNYLTEIAGGDVAYVKHGFIVQGEATLQQSVRVRGEKSAAASDVARTRAAVGAHIGVYIGSHVSLGADLLYQRWLSHPTKLDFMTGARAPISDADMAALTASVGVRAHFNVGQVSVHPGCRSREGSTRPARRLVR